MKQKPYQKFYEKLKESEDYVLHWCIQVNVIHIGMENLENIIISPTHEYSKNK